VAAAAAVIMKIYCVISTRLVRPGRLEGRLLIKYLLYTRACKRVIESNFSSASPERRRRRGGREGRGEGF